MCDQPVENPQTNEFQLFGQPETFKNCDNCFKEFYAIAPRIKQNL